MSLHALTPRWLAYCATFAQSLNMREARDASGLSARLIKKYADDPLVLAEITRHMTTIVNVANVDKAMLLQKLYEFLESDVIDIYYPDMSFKPLCDWPKTIRQMIVSFEIDPETRTPIKVKFLDRMRVIETLGKHVDVGAWEEKITHKHDFSDRLLDRMSKGRKRIGQGTTYDNGE